jgi:hypothetical protein
MLVIKVDYEDAINRIFMSSKDELENIKKLNDEAQKLIDNNEADEKNMDDLSFEMEKNLSKIEERICHSRNEFYEMITSRKNRMELMEQFEDYLEEKLKEYGLQSDEEEED